MVGLFCLMAMCGLFVPARRATVSIFDEIYCDIGDAQSIEESLSTFSSHITNIIRITNDANARSLVLIDELGGGTDPEEGRTRHPFFGGRVPLSFDKRSKHGR